MAGRVKGAGTLLPPPGLCVCRAASGSGSTCSVATRARWLTQHISPSRRYTASTVESLAAFILHTIHSLTRPRSVTVPSLFRKCQDTSPSFARRLRCSCCDHGHSRCRTYRESLSRETSHFERKTESLLGSDNNNICSLLISLTVASRSHHGLAGQFSYRRDLFQPRPSTAFSLFSLARFDFTSFTTCPSTRVRVAA